MTCEDPPCEISAPNAWHFFFPAFSPLSSLLSDTSSARRLFCLRSGERAQSRRWLAHLQVGSRLLVIGGETPERRALGDVSVLDMKRLEWSAVSITGDRPAPRAGHVAAR